MKVFKTGIFLMASLLLAGCSGAQGEVSSTSSSTAAQESSEQVLNLSVASELPTLDTALMQDTISGTALNQVMEGLYRLDMKEEPIPAIADGAPEVSEDGLTYTFNIKPDLVWSNGDAITAHDFEYAWKRVADPATAANMSYLLKDFANAESVLAGEADPDTLGVEATNDLELKVTLTKPINNFFGLLANPTFFPLNEAFVIEMGSSFGTNSESALYNGPFVMEEWDGTGLTWTYKKNADYWDAENVALTTVNNQVIKDTSTGLNLYQAGQIDNIALTGEFAQQYKADPEFVAPLAARSVYLELDHTNKPELKNKKLREALALSISRDEFANNIIANGSEALGGLVSKDLVSNPETGEDFREDSGDFLAEDLEKAQALWAEAQEELGVSTVELELVSDDDETTKKASQYLQNAIESNLEGVKVTIKSVPFKMRVELGDNGEFDLLLSGWGVDNNEPLEYLTLFQTGSVFNGGKWSNAEYDKYVNASLNEDSDDPVKKWQNDLAAEKILLDEVGIIPLYQKANSMLMSSSVKGYVISQMNYVNLKYVSIEE